MTIRRQKDIELAQLEKTLKLLDIRQYEIIDKDNESPDFILKINGQSVGIEVTEIYRKLGASNSAKTESDLPIIVEESIKIYNKKGGTPFVFGISFNGKAAVENRKSVCRDLGEFLYGYSKNFLQNHSLEIQNIVIDREKHPSLDLISAIFAKATENSSAVGFTVSGFDSVPVENTALESTVHKKLALLPTYRQKCEIIWLLITLPSMKLSADLRLPDTELTSQHNGFDAIYVLDDYRSQVRSIKQA
jgi:hypothetical protein